MANDTVLWAIDRRGVATVTLNRPKVNNAYNGDLIQGLHEKVYVGVHLPSAFLSRKPST